MNPKGMKDLSSLSMLELFRVEAETQTGVLTNGLLDLERGPATPQQLETLMRAAHSLKGAARIVNLQVAVRVAHALEDCFAAAQNRQLQLGQQEIDVLFRGIDLLQQIALRTEADIAQWEQERATDLHDFLEALARMIPDRRPVVVPRGEGRGVKAEAASTAKAQPAVPGPRESRPEPASERRPARVGAAEVTWAAPLPPEGGVPAAGAAGPMASKPEAPERVVRLAAENLNRLLGLAGESLVESRWLRPFGDSLQRLKRSQTELAEKLDLLRRALEPTVLPERAQNQLSELALSVAECRQALAGRLEELDLFDRRAAHLSHRLYLEVLRTRMRPFGDGIASFPRMVRDLARSLNKEARLEISGEDTQVDRDILERLEAPLAHLLRNAVDHGCETPDQRRRSGKPAEAVIRLEARHSAGMLLVSVSDDGAGVDAERIRQAVLQRNLAPSEVAARLTESELFEFLFLPGFTLKETVTELSGRGVGLDVVQNMIKSVRGSIRITTRRGQGARFQLHLPLTLSVLRTLLVEIAGEPYAFPLSQILRTVKLPRDRIEALEGRHHFRFEGQQIGLLTAHQVLDCPPPKPPGAELPVVLLADRATRYGLVVDRFLGERELVVQPLDPRLGKVKDISAAALMEDGSPVLIVDVEDMVRSIEKLISGGQLARAKRDVLELAPRRLKRVLAVDDSLTVRELERKLLLGRGYAAEVAVDGMDGWNAVRMEHFDLVITDVDMPRIDGIELTRLIKNDPQLKSLPVMIVSYKDRPEDRARGLEAGADYYLTKGSFQDESLLQAVVDLIGEPET